MTESAAVEIDGQTLPFEELRRRRGLIKIPHELLMRMTDHGTDYVVLGVYTDWATSQVALMVVHPNLLEVSEGAMPPTLDSPVSLWRDFVVVGEQVYARSELRPEDPQVKASEDRRELRGRLQAVIENYAPDAVLDGLLARLREEALARQPVSADAFLESLL